MFGVFSGVSKVLGFMGPGGAATGAVVSGVLDISQEIVEG